MDYSIKNLTR